MISSLPEWTTGKKREITGPGADSSGCLFEVAGRELTKAAIDDIITRGTIGTWRKLTSDERR